MVVSSKGFLGPIGDDLPSLIPLVFALTIFFYVFTFSWNVFDERNNDFANDIAILRISSVLRANSYVSGYDGFLERCNEAKGFKKVRFKAGLIPLSVRLDEHFKGIDVAEAASGNYFFKDEFNGNLAYACSNTDEELDLLGGSFLVRFYPVALEREYVDAGKKHFFVKPMLLVVISW